MSARRFEYQEGFPIKKQKYYEEYSDEEMEKRDSGWLKEQLEIEKKRYYAIDDLIDIRQGNIEVFKGPSDDKIDLDSGEIERLKREKNLRAENIVKLCSRLGIERIDLRVENSGGAKKAINKK